MKFLADECCDLSMVNRLREEGHDVDYILERRPGISDTEILMNAYKEMRVLITEDKDFGELVYRLKKPAFGIVLLRFHPLDREHKLLRMIQLANNFQPRLKGNFLVVDAKKIRIKSLNY